MWGDFEASLGTLRRFQLFLYFLLFPLFFLDFFPIFLGVAFEDFYLNFGILFASGELKTEVKISDFFILYSFRFFFFANFLGGDTNEIIRFWTDGISFWGEFSSWSLKNFKGELQGFFLIDSWSLIDTMS